MTAPHPERQAQRIARPHTIRGVRAALTDEQRARFDAAILDADAVDLLRIVRQWGAVAQAQADPQTAQQADAVLAGAARTHSIGDIFPALAGRH